MNKKFLLLGMLVLLLPLVSALPFMNYGHDAFWNDTAEVGTPGGNGWTGASSYSATQAFNGTKSFAPVGGAATNSLSMAASMPANYNVTFAIYSPAANSTSGPTTYFWAGIRATAGACGGDGLGVCVGWQYNKDTSNFRVLVDNDYTVSANVPLSLGWHMAEIRITGNTNYQIWVDGTLIKSGTSSNAGKQFNVLYSGTLQPYLDDMHAWNATVGAAPAPPGSALTLSVNDTRTNTTLTGFSYLLTNGTVTWSGYCASTSCSQNTTNITDGTLYLFNITGGSYFNTSVASITFNTTNAQTVQGLTWRNSITLNATNIVNNTALLNFCGRASNGTSQLDACTTNGSITIYNVYGDTTVLWQTIESSTYFNVTGTLTTYNSSSLSLQANTSQGRLTISAAQKFTNAAISAFNASNGRVSNNTVSSSLSLPANIGTQSVTVNVSGNYSTTVSCTVPSALQTVSCGASGIYDNLFTIGAHSFTGANVLTFSVLVTNATLGGLLYNASTTNGSVQFALLQGYQYSFYLNNSLFVPVQQTLPANSLTNLYNFTLISTNSVTILVYDEQTGQLVSGNSTMQMIGTYQQYNFSIVAGSGFYDLLAPDTYNVLVTAPGYYLRNSIVSIEPQTTQTVVAYLLNSTTVTNAPVVYYVIDQTGLSLSNVTITSQLLRNTTWTTVEGRTTDVSGQARLYYDTNTYYRVTFSKPGYITQVNDFQPASGSYTIRMIEGDSISFTTLGDSVTYSTTPTADVLSPGVYNFSLITSSTTGALSNFGVRYGTSSQNVTVCPTGCTAYVTGNLSSLDPGSVVTVSYWLQTVNDSYFNWTRQYYISSHPQNANGTMGGTANKYAAQLGVGGKIIFGVVIILFTLLALAAFIPAGALAIIGLVLLIGVTIIGLFPVWLGIVFSLMVGLGIFVAR